VAKMVTLPEFLTTAEIERAVKLYREAGIGKFAARCEAEIIAPILPRIQETLGQEMNARYVAYMVEYVMLKTQGK
jgi:hypothetical protein